MACACPSTRAPQLNGRRLPWWMWTVGPAIASLDAASTVAQNTITTVSKALDATNTSRNLQANPTIDSTSDSSQASANVTLDDLNVTNTNPDLQADSTTNNTSVSSQAPANAPQPNIENDPTTCPSATHNEASLLSDLPVTLDNLNVETIKAILSGKNLNSTGRKHDLVNRLRVHLAQHPNLPTPTV